MAAFPVEIATSFDRLRMSGGVGVLGLSLRAQRGNLVAVAMVVCRRVFNVNEIATSLRSSQ